jgi:hypothetical protein
MASMCLFTGFLYMDMNVRCPFNTLNFPLMPFLSAVHLVDVDVDVVEPLLSSWPLSLNRELDFGSLTFWIRLRVAHRV